MPRTLNIIVLAATLVAVALLADSWRTAHKNSLQLAATIAAQNALIEQSSTRQSERDKQLALALATIAQQKQRIKTPQQALEAIPSVLPQLPLPIKISAPDLTQPPNPQEGAEASLAIPQADLKPLYDALQDCRACALERDATKKNLVDEQSKVAALTQERNAAVTAARGGNFWSRVKHSAKWFAIGLAAGAIARSTVHR